MRMTSSNARSAARAKNGPPCDQNKNQESFREGTVNLAQPKKKIEDYLSYFGFRSIFKVRAQLALQRYQPSVASIDFFANHQARKIILSVCPQSAQRKLDGGLAECPRKLSDLPRQR